MGASEHTQDKRLCLVLISLGGYSCADSSVRISAGKLIPSPSLSCFERVRSFMLLIFYHLCLASGPDCSVKTYSRRSSSCWEVGFCKRGLFTLASPHSFLNQQESKCFTQLRWSDAFPPLYLTSLKAAAVCVLRWCTVSL